MRVMHRKRRDFRVLCPSFFSWGPQNSSLQEAKGCHRNVETGESMQTSKTTKQ